jgi:rare lipoprotein A
VRPQNHLRAERPRNAAARVLSIAAGIAVAAPLAVTAAPAQGSPALVLSDPTPSYGQTVVVSGRGEPLDAGHSASLEFAAPGGEWQVIRTAKVGTGGSYSFTVRLIRSGQLRVTVGEAPHAAQAAAAGQPVLRAGPRAVSVGSQLTVTRRHLELLGGWTATVAGFLRPARAGSLVLLERLSGGTWRPLASTRTGSSGAYHLSFRAPGASTLVRLTHDGGGANAPAVQPLGRVGVYRRAVASRYDLYGGALACGGHLGYESLVVAHRSLPCGSHVTIHYRGRTVEARVMDRGPFVGGREFDLAGAVARRLGFNGVGTIWVSH